MNVIITKNFVAGIFEHWADAVAYIALKPPDLGFMHINSDLQYPFYLLETDDGQFTGYQLSETFANVAGILFTIREDYRPQPIWSDQMGSLEHIHLVSELD